MLWATRTAGQPIWQHRFYRAKIGSTLRVSRLYPFPKTGLPVFSRGYTRFPMSGCFVRELRTDLFSTSSPILQKPVHCPQNVYEPFVSFRAQGGIPRLLPSGRRSACISVQSVDPNEVHASDSEIWRQKLVHPTFEVMTISIYISFQYTRLSKRHCRPLRGRSETFRGRQCFLNCFRPRSIPHHSKCRMNHIPERSRCFAK